MYTAKSLGTIVSNAVLVTSNIRLEYSLSMNGDRATVYISMETKRSTSITDREVSILKIESD